MNEETQKPVAEILESNEQGIFKGRLSRGNYLFALSLIFIVFGFLFFLFMGAADLESTFLSILVITLFIALFILYFGATTRRMHDLGHSNWFPAVGIFKFVLLAEGDRNANKYGPVPDQKLNFLQALLGRSK